jgi:hypothetical protein
MSEWSIEHAWKACVILCGEAAADEDRHAKGLTIIAANASNVGDVIDGALDAVPPERQLQLVLQSTALRQMFSIDATTGVREGRPELNRTESNVPLLEGDHVHTLIGSKRCKNGS